MNINILKLNFNFKLDHIEYDNHDDSFHVKMNTDSKLQKPLSEWQTETQCECECQTQSQCK